MSELIMNVPCMLALTVGAYLLGVWLKRKSGWALLHPFLISIPVIICVLHLTGIPADYYIKGNAVIEFLLGPCVVALGLKLYDYVDLIRRNFLSLAVSVLCGALSGIVSVWLLWKLFGLDEIFLLSMAAKSVTTPIAMDLTSGLGGNVSLAVVSVVMCGFIGAVLGPWVVKVLGFKSEIAKGMAMGCASHGLGTSRALEESALQGAISGLAMALMGVATSLLIPLVSVLEVGI